MGRVIDPKDPVIDPNKHYCVELASFYSYPYTGGCDMDYRENVACCRLGSRIQEWLSAGRECTGGYVEDPELCPANGYNAQRIVNIKGPYDTEGECGPDCPAP